jgi:hypothetical protein
MDEHQAGVEKWKVDCDEWATIVVYIKENVVDTAGTTLMDARFASIRGPPGFRRPGLKPHKTTGLFKIYDVYSLLVSGALSVVLVPPVTTPHHTTGV